MSETDEDSIEVTVNTLEKLLQNSITKINTEIKDNSNSELKGLTFLKLPPVVSEDYTVEYIFS